MLRVAEAGFVLYNDILFFSHQRKDKHAVI